MIVDHLCVFFGEMCIQPLCPFFSRCVWVIFNLIKLINLFFGCVGSSLLCTGFLYLQRVWSSHCGGLLRNTGSRRVGFSSCAMWAQQLWLAGSRAQAQQLWCTGLVALWHVGSSRTRDQTPVPCVGRQILNHCATREVPGVVFFLLGCKRCLCILDPYQIFDLQIFSPICGLSFHSCHGILCAKSFYLANVQFICFFFLTFILLVSYLNPWS